MRDTPKIDLQELEIADAIQEQVKQSPTTSDPQLERTIVAVALRSEWADAIASACLSDKDFTSLTARTLWKAKNTLRDRGVDRNPITLQSEISSLSSLKAVGGEEGIQAFYAEIGEEKDIGSYCEQLRNFTIARSQAKAGRDLQSLARKPMPAMDRLEKTQELLGEIIASGVGRSTMETPTVASDRIGYDKLMDPTIGCSYITTGWAPFNKLVVGFEPGSFNVLGGRPGGGKSAWACQLALHTALTLKKPVALFSLEMTTKSTLGRMACNVGKVDYEKYRRGELDEGSKDNLATAFSLLSEAPLYINDRRGYAVGELEQELYSLIAQGITPELVVIDHLQKMRFTGKYRDMREAYTQIVEDLTKMFKRLGIACLLLSQLTKAGKKSSDRPVASDLRETGQVDDNADWIGLLHQPYKGKQGATPEERRKIELIIAKQRAGQDGVVEFDFYGEYFNFIAIDRANAW